MAEADPQEETHMKKPRIGGFPILDIIIFRSEPFSTQVQ